MPTDKILNDLLAFCPEFYVVIWHFFCLNFFLAFYPDYLNIIWHFVQIMKFTLNITTSLKKFQSTFINTLEPH